VYSSSVTDAQWAILEPLLAAPGSMAGRGERPEKHCRRAKVDAVLDILRGDIAWRQLPVEFPPAGTVYAVFARRLRGGAWQRTCLQPRIDATLQGEDHASSGRGPHATQVDLRVG